MPCSQCSDCSKLSLDGLACALSCPKLAPDPFDVGLTRLGFVLFDTGVQRGLRQLSSWILDHSQARTPASESRSIKHSTWTRSSSQAPVLVAFNNNDLPCTQATASFLVIRHSYFCSCINIKCIIHFNHWNMFTIKPLCDMCLCWDVSCNTNFAPRYERTVCKLMFQTFLVRGCGDDFALKLIECSS